MPPQQCCLHFHIFFFCALCSLFPHSLHHEIGFSFHIIYNKVFVLLSILQFLKRFHIFYILKTIFAHQGFRKILRSCGLWLSNLFCFVVVLKRIHMGIVYYGPFLCRIIGFHQFLFCLLFSFWFSLESKGI